MTQYLLSVIHPESGPEWAGDTSPEDMQAVFEAVDTFNTELQESGSWVFAGGLTAPSDATVVDATGGETLFTDGPFSEAKEQLGGFWVIEAPDLDAALAIAGRGSAACRGPVEVRPFQGK